MSLLPRENATGNFVKVVQRLPVGIGLNHGEDPDHLLRLGMSVESKSVAPLKKQPTEARAPAGVSSCSLTVS
jgi:multidrug resistance efflux pump